MARHDPAHGKASSHIVALSHHRVYHRIEVPPEVPPYIITVMAWFTSPRTVSYLADEDILRVEEISVSLALDHVDHAWLQVQQQGSRYVVVVVCLVEEHVFAVVPLCVTSCHRQIIGARVRLRKERRWCSISMADRT